MAPSDRRAGRSRRRRRTTFTFVKVGLARLEWDHAHAAVNARALVLLAARAYSDPITIQYCAEQLELAIQACKELEQTQETALLQM